MNISLTKSIFFAVSGLVMLAGCATQTPYQPAEKAGKYGYTETRLTSDRYRVVFTGNPSTPADTTRDFALLRAAEVTLQNGGDWFQLMSRNTDKKVQYNSVEAQPIVVPQTTAYQRCGVLRCQTVVNTQPVFVGGVSGGTTTQSTAYSSEVEVVIGKFPMPDNVESYDARQLATSLRRMLIKSS